MRTDTAIVTMLVASFAACSPTTEEAANNPLVKAVLDTFNGTVKQVYPRK